MLGVGTIDSQQYEAATSAPVLVAPKERRTDHGLGPYFSEEVRRHLEGRYGADRLYGAGLQVYTTVDPLIQQTVEGAVKAQLLALDHRKGWRGPTLTLPPGDLESQVLPSWQELVLEPDGWYEGIVIDVSSNLATIKIADEHLVLELPGIEWTRRRRIRDVLATGDVAWFRLEQPVTAKGAADPTAGWIVHLEQEPELESAAVVIESATGAVRAMVGGWSFDRSKFNRATQAQRQVGSAFKPFIYGTALENGFTPADTLFDGPIALTGADNQVSYSPRNHTRRYFGIITLRRALESSVNVISVKLLDLVGIDRAIEFARRCGIRSDLPPYPSLALGSADLVPIELAAAYATFANQGIYVQPYLLEKVTTPSGRLLEEHLTQAHKALEPQVAYVLTHMLEGVVDRGSGAALSRLDVALAGKTGTTNDYSDAWFVGFTPKHTMLVWVGYDVKRSIGRGMTGSAAALPIWKAVAEAGLESGWIETGGAFPVPAGIDIVGVERRTGLLPSPGSRVVIIEDAFLAGTQPTLAYDPEWNKISLLPWYQQRPFYIPKEGELMPEDLDSEQWALIVEGWRERDRKN